MEKLFKRNNPTKPIIEEIISNAGTLQLSFSMLSMNGGKIAVDDDYRAYEQGLKVVKHKIENGKYQEANKYYQDFAKYALTDQIMLKQTENANLHSDALGYENPKILSELALNISNQLRKLE